MQPPTSVRGEVLLSQKMVSNKYDVNTRAGKQHTTHTAYATQRTAHTAEAL